MSQRTNTNQCTSSQEGKTTGLYSECSLAWFIHITYHLIDIIQPLEKEKIEAHCVIHGLRAYVNGDENKKRARERQREYPEDRR